ncbi:12310_t:CDS:2, partial [Entrophospora sp. SA101]
MGKRKSKRKLKPKKKLVLETQFDCVICNHERSVDVRMQKEAKVGYLTSLSDPIDVYSEWVDYTDETVENRNDDNDDNNRKSSTPTTPRTP